MGSNLTIKDAGLIRRAIRSRWNITPKMRTQALAVVEQNMDADDPRDRAEAVKILLAMDKLNQADEHKAQPDVSITMDIQNMSNEEIEQRLAQLGHGKSREEAMDELALPTPQDIIDAETGDPEGQEYEDKPLDHIIARARLPQGRHDLKPRIAINSQGGGRND